MIYYCHIGFFHGDYVGIFADLNGLKRVNDEQGHYLNKNEYYKAYPERKYR